MALSNNMVSPGAKKGDGRAAKSKVYWGYLEGWVSVVVNTLLFGYKLWAGIVTHSIAIIADAWETLSDVLTSFVVIAGFKFSSKAADREHPFGHGRIEIITAVIIATLLVAIGVHFFVDSFQRLSSHETAHYGLLGILAVVASVIVKELLAQFSIRLGKMTDSKSLIAAGWHHRSDSLSSVFVLIGIFAFGRIWWIDAAMGIGVSFFIIWAAIEIMRDSVSTLIGEEPSEKFKAQLSGLLGQEGFEYSSIHHIHLHRYGDHAELTFHLLLDPALDLNRAHTIADGLETKIKDAMGVEPTIHVEPRLY